MRDTSRIFTAQSKVWLWRPQKPSAASWFFAIIDPQISSEIRFEMLGLTRRFGSVPVTATIGETSWRTSMFPSKEMNGYLLPLKASVRKAEGLEIDDEIEVLLAI